MTGHAVMPPNTPPRLRVVCTHAGTRHDGQRSKELGRFGVVLDQEGAPVFAQIMSPQRDTARGVPYSTPDALQQSPNGDLKVDVRCPTCGLSWQRRVDGLLPLLAVREGITVDVSRQ